MSGNQPQVVSPQQLMQMLQGSQQKQKWTDMLKEIINKIEDLPENPKDRLDTIVSMKLCLGTIAVSLKGWNQWYKTIMPFNDLTEDEIKEIYLAIRKATLDLLSLDFKVTKKAEDIAEERGTKERKKAEKKTSKKKKTNGDKPQYVT